MQLAVDMYSMPARNWILRVNCISLRLDHEIGVFPEK